MILKRTVIVASLLAALSVLAFGQVSTGTAKQGHERKVHARNHLHRGALRDRLAQKLNLSDEQKSRLQALRTKFRGEMKALRAAPGDRAAKKAQAKALAQDRMTQLKAILTPAQVKQLEAMRSKIHKTHRDKGASRHKTTTGKTPPPA